MTSTRSPFSCDWLVGIDLGTSHTVVASTALGRDPDPEAAIEIFPLEQLVRPGEVEALPLLPSVRYQSSREEMSPADLRLPWAEEPTDCQGPDRPILGELARSLGAKSPGRLVTSAKSWLSYAGAERMSPILPWHGSKGVSKVSPLEASAGYLRHILEAWNHAHPDAPLENQDVVLTVPASFDELARTLTLEAAKLAGFEGVHLLEEPQAVCYDWLWRTRHEKERSIEGLRLILVVDLGGGTLDLSLLSVAASTRDREARFTRIAVGQHLMLGGDNLDLAVAHLAMEKLRLKGESPLPEEFPQWVELSRKAKEILLCDEAPDHHTMTLLGRGGRLLSGAKSIELDRQEVVEALLDGFFPTVALNAFPEKRRSAFLEMGLPYVADPRITSHIAAFLHDHQAAVSEALGIQGEPCPLPDALLLNGGIFKSRRVTERLLEQFRFWGAFELRLLPNPRPETSVAHGAVAYGKARRALGIRKIGGGAARTVFLLMPGPDGDLNQACCLLPRGSEEDHPIPLEGRSFILKIGIPVEFILAEALDDLHPAPGTLIPLSQCPHRILPPLRLTLHDELASSVERQVVLEARLSGVGTVELNCVDVENPEQRWRIEFELRSRAGGIQALKPSDHPGLHEAEEMIRRVFGAKSRDADPKAAKRLRGELERILGPRDHWDLSLLRALSRVLMEGFSNRRRSLDHERLWLNLAGFCLRPGYGDPKDPEILEGLIGIFEKGPQFVNESQIWSEWWTFWRRLAGGLGEAAQKLVFEGIRPYLDPSRLRLGNQAALAKKRSPEDLIRLVAVLERLPVKVKLEVGQWILARLDRPAEPKVLWWALGRIGSRVPLYGSSFEIIPAHDILCWVDRLLKYQLRDHPDAGFALALLTRCSGDPDHDFSDEIRFRVADALLGAKMPPSWQAMVRERSDLSDADEKRVSGESLPPGLRLAE